LRASNLATKLFIHVDKSASEHIHKDQDLNVLLQNALILMNFKLIAVRAVACIIIIIIIYSSFVPHGA